MGITLSLFLSLTCSFRLRMYQISEFPLIAKNAKRTHKFNHRFRCIMHLYLVVGLMIEKTNRHKCSINKKWSHNYCHVSLLCGAQVFCVSVWKFRLKSFLLQPNNKWHKKQEGEKRRQCASLIQIFYKFRPSITFFVCMSYIWLFLESMNSALGSYAYISILATCHTTPKSQWQCKDIASSLTHIRPILTDYANLMRTEHERRIQSQTN